MTSTLEETIGGIRIIKGFGAENYQAKKFGAENIGFKDILTRLLWRRDMSAPLSEFLGITVVTVLLYYGSILVFDDLLQPETFFTFVFAFYPVSYTHLDVYKRQDETGYNFMDNETFDQVTIAEAMLDSPQFLKEGSDIDILFHAEKDIPLTTEFPAAIILEVTYTEPGVRGDTATNVTKPATVETGAEVKVPIFINQGDKIKIDTKTGAYLERVKA